jgi:hypothetical protein
MLLLKSKTDLQLTTYDLNNLRLKQLTTNFHN